MKQIPVAFLTVSYAVGNLTENILAVLVNHFRRPFQVPSDLLRFIALIGNSVEGGYGGAIL